MRLAGEKFRVKMKITEYHKLLVETAIECDGKVTTVGKLLGSRSKTCRKRIDELCKYYHIDYKGYFALKKLARLIDEDLKKK